MGDKNIQWTRVTADRTLLNKPGWLHCAYFVPSAAAGNVVIRDGSDANGDTVINLVTAELTMLPFDPPSPVRLQRGLFIDWGTTAESLLVGYQAED